MPSGYRETGEALSREGVSVLVFDRRGSGHSAGRRGDGDIAGKHFHRDLEAAVRLAAQEAGEVHLLANCFSTRFVLPFACDHVGALRSIIITSPATDMKRQADYGPLAQAGIAFALPFDTVPGIDIPISTPLRNRFFVSSGPKLDWIDADQWDLHYVTPSFLTGARRLTKAMENSLEKLQTPLFVLLAESDAIVKNGSIRERFGRYSGPLRIKELPSEHMLEFGGSRKRYRQEVLTWVRGGYRMAGIPSQATTGARLPIPARAMWLANGSQVDFEGLDELEAQIFGRGITTLGVDERGKEVPLPRFEGFFDDYVEGSYIIPRSRQMGSCLSPEAEWALVFSDPAQLNAVYCDTDPSRIDERIRALRVEFRGMIEGKWLDVLAREAKHPQWIPASGGNNVVTPSGWRTTIGELDAGALPRPTQVSVYRVARGGSPTPGEDPLFFSTLGDVRDSDHFKALSANSKGAPPFFSITRAVLERFHQRTNGAQLSQLRAINLSAMGKRSALVNSPERRNAAANTFVGTKIALALGTYAGVKKEQKTPRIGMHLITSKAVREGASCLDSEHDYLLIHTVAGPGTRELGRARLRLED